MVCQECGAENQNGNFCGECGEKLKEMKQTKKPLEIQQEIQWLQMENEFLQKSRERWIFVTILSTVAAFMGIVANVISFIS